MPVYKGVHKDGWGKCKKIRTDCKETPKMKEVVAIITNEDKTKEMYQFDTSDECARVLEMTPLEVQLAGDMHIVIKRGNQKIKIICDELRLKRMTNKKYDQPGYHPEFGMVWIKLDNPIYDYTEISNFGELRKRKDSDGKTVRKKMVVKDKVAFWRFKKEIGYEMIEVEKVFENYKSKFDAAFGRILREEKENGRQKAKA